MLPKREYLLSDRDALAAAVAAVVANARRVAPQARLDGVLVSGMVAGGVETIVGVVNDEGFGPVVAFGLGGVLAETLNDMSYRVAPFGIEEAGCMIAELRAAQDKVEESEPQAIIDALIRMARDSEVLKTPAGLKEARLNLLEADRLRTALTAHRNKERYQIHNEAAA